jgi:DNA-binding transcriptional MerR regulator
VNSSELSSLAGVTIRTLRHYHRVGILDEPPRGANRYRQYGVHDLIRVLRIRRLAALGIPLEQMPGLLDDEDPGADAVLDRLDDEIAAQIERLTAQRELIGQLRLLSATPDVPPELARFLGDITAASSPDAARIDRDQTVLLAHLVGTTGMPHLVRFYERMSDPELLPAMTETAAAFDKLGTDTTENGLEQYVDRFIDVFSPIATALSTEAPDMDLSPAASLFAEYTESVLNPIQQQALSMIGRRLDDLRG